MAPEILDVATVAKSGRHRLRATKWVHAGRRAKLARKHQPQLAGADWVPGSRDVFRDRVVQPCPRISASLVPFARHSLNIARVAGTCNVFIARLCGLGGCSKSARTVLQLSLVAPVPQRLSGLARDSVIERAFWALRRAVCAINYAILVVPRATAERARLQGL